MGLNLKDEKSGGTIEPVPTGRYTVKIFNAELGKTQKEQDIINLTYLILEGPQEKRRFFDRVVITKNSLWKLKTLLTIVDSPLAESSDVELDSAVEALKDKKLSVHVEVAKNDDGKTQYSCSGWQKVTTPISTNKTEKKINILE